MHPAAALGIAIVAILLIWFVCANITALLVLVVLGTIGGLIFWSIKLIISGNWLGFIPLIVVIAICILGMGMRNRDGSGGGGTTEGWY